MGTGSLSKRDITFHDDIADDSADCNTGVCRLPIRYMCLDMWEDMCMYICIDMCMDMRMDMCIDMCVDMRIDMYV